MDLATGCGYRGLKDNTRGYGAGQHQQHRESLKICQNLTVAIFEDTLYSAVPSLPRHQRHISASLVIPHVHPPADENHEHQDKCATSARYCEDQARLSRPHLERRDRRVRRPGRQSKQKQHLPAPTFSRRAQKRPYLKSDMLACLLAAALGAKCEEHSANCLVCVDQDGCGYCWETGRCLPANSTECPTGDFDKGRSKRCVEILGGDAKNAVRYAIGFAILGAALIIDLVVRFCVRRKARAEEYSHL